MGVEEKLYCSYFSNRLKNSVKLIEKYAQILAKVETLMFVLPCFMRAK